VIASGTFTGQGALEVTRKDVSTMNTGQWLNDEMVNFTIGIMADREAARCGGAVGLYKLNYVLTHSLKAPGFNP
jgi:hypothetical protein